MTVSELINELQLFIEEHGDMLVRKIDKNCDTASVDVPSKYGERNGIVCVM